ncbi:SDR family NAD(P)-dependent oxidoreductase, partial [archaeon]
MLRYGSIVLNGLGALVVVSGIWKSASWVNLNMLTTASMSEYGANTGAYAVITGASDGLGKALAHEGAKRGFNLVLISRSQDKLVRVAEDIQSKHPVKVLIIACDCSKSIQSNVASIQKQCTDLPVRVLWNNVGVNTGDSAALEDISPSDLESIVNTNCLFTISLTSAMIPLMKRQVALQEGKAAIANVSSFLSVLPAAHYVAYSASKGFINQFSRALHCELEESGIIVSN